MVKKVERWSVNVPTEPGKYRFRDTVFGFKCYVRIFEWNGMLMTRPEDESDDQSVALKHAPTWWEWRKVK